MILWVAVIATSLGCYGLKLAGYLIPGSILSHPRIDRILGILPLVLLSALLATQTFADGQRLVIDARVAGVIVAGILLWRRAPFIVAVAAAAVVAAVIRLLGWG
ncbi:AzlD domain-containing protein [Devriesea agamarum]|uniref:AzlD domain-containing protein n=1 Tax=Devriesea agamarum TaxID=472569 RepID=UPI00071CB20D|nr:AzlD domain-containing protein [Devriesea agamarum]